MYIYKTVCKSNNKIYIGKCIRSINASKRYIGSGVLLKAAIYKYGIENFEKHIIEECNSIEQLNLKEKYWITYFNSTNKDIGYNIAVGGNGGDTISNHPKKDLIAKNYSKWNSLYWTKEARNKRSLMYIGKNNPFYNKTHTDNVCKQISSSKTEKQLSDDHKRKISESILNLYKNGKTVNVTNQMRIDASKRMIEYNTSEKKKNFDIELKTKMKGENNPSSKMWQFTCVNGNTVFIKGSFQKFCKEHNLSIKSMRLIACGKRKNMYCNNWTVKELLTKD